MIKQVRLQSLTVDSSDTRSRRGSEAPSAIGFNPPRRTDTNTTLPPYTPGPGINWNAGETPRAKTPAEILGLKVDTGGEKSDSDVKFGKSKALLESDEVPSGKIFASPQSSPTALRPKRSSPELDKDVDVKPLPTRQNTATEVATPPDALGIYGSYPTSTYSTSPTLSRVFSSPAGFSIAPSRQTSHGDTISSLSRQDSYFSLDSALPEMTMYNLTGAKMYVAAPLNSERIAINAERRSLALTTSQKVEYHIQSPASSPSGTARRDVAS